MKNIKYTNGTIIKDTNYSTLTLVNGDKKVYTATIPTKSIDAILTTYKNITVA
jgi:hypothetical protein